ncbi:MAG: hypothetical protein AABW59_01730 [archaeon]
MEQKKGLLGNRPLLVVIVLGAMAILGPWFSTYVATVSGVTSISMFNATMLMIFSVLLEILLFLRTIFALHSGNQKALFVGVVLAIIAMISFLMQLLVFVTLS